MATESAARALEFRAQVGGVVDLAVLNKHPLASRGLHGLRTIRGQVNYAEPTMAQCDARVQVRPITTCVRTTMLQGLGHRDHVLLDIAAACLIQYTGHSAHMI